MYFASFIAWRKLARFTVEVAFLVVSTVFLLRLFSLEWGPWAMAGVVILAMAWSALLNDRL